GAGSVAKLVHNCAGYAIQTCLAEVFTMGVKAGVEPLALWEAVRQGAGGRRRTFDALGDHFLTDSYDPPDFALRLAHKDVTLAAAVRDAAGAAGRRARARRLPGHRQSAAGGSSKPPRSRSRSAAGRSAARA